VTLSCGRWCATSDRVRWRSEQLSRVFERFYRADTAGNIPGTGLGLNLVREIAQIHDGDVTLSSQYGVGTVATLRLKLASLTTEEPVTANA